MYDHQMEGKPPQAVRYVTDLSWHAVPEGMHFLNDEDTIGFESPELKTPDATVDLGYFDPRLLRQFAELLAFCTTGWFGGQARYDSVRLTLQQFDQPATRLAARRYDRPGDAPLFTLAGQRPKMLDTDGGER
jgi:hypothetical protein